MTRGLEQKLKTDPRIVMKPLERWPKLLMGMIQLNANNVPGSLDALNRWLQDGPYARRLFSGRGTGSPHLHSS